MKYNFTFAGMVLYFCIATNAAIAAHLEQQILTHKDLALFSENVCTDASCTKEALTILERLHTQSQQPDWAMLPDDLSLTNLIAFLERNHLVSSLRGQISWVAISPRELQLHLRQVPLASWRRTGKQFRAGLVLLKPNAIPRINAAPYLATFYVYKVRSITRAFIIDPKLRAVVDEFSFANTYGDLAEASICYNIADVYDAPHQETGILDEREGPAAGESVDEELPEHIQKLFTIIAPHFDRTAFLDEYARMNLEGKSEVILAKLKELEPLRKRRTSALGSEDYSALLNELCWKALFDIKAIHSKHSNDEELAFTYLAMLQFFCAHDVVPPKWSNKAHSLIKKISTEVHRITSASEDLSAKVAKWAHIHEGEFSIILAAHDVQNRDQHLQNAYLKFQQAAAAHTTQATHLHIAKLILVHGYHPVEMTPEEAKKMAYEHIEMALASTAATTKPCTTNRALKTKSTVAKFAQPAYLPQRAKIDAFAASTEPSLPQAIVEEPAQNSPSPMREDSLDEQEIIATTDFSIPFTDEDFVDIDQLMASQQNMEKVLHPDVERQPRQHDIANELSKEDQRAKVLTKRREMAKALAKTPSALAVHQELADPRISYSFVLETLKAEGYVKGHGKHVSLTTAEAIRRAYFDLPRGAAKPSPKVLAKKFDVKVSQVKGILRKPVTPEKQRKRLDKVTKILAEFDELNDDEQKHAATIIAARTGIAYGTVRSILIQHHHHIERETKSKKKRARDEDQHSEDDGFKRRKK